MSKRPKIFQAIVNGFAYDFLLVIAFAIKILVNAVAIAPIPDM